MYRFDISPDLASEIKDIIQPKGWQVLVAMPEVIEKLGNIHIPQNTGTQEQTAAIVGVVIACGPEAYKDTEKFPAGAWCDEGDYVLFRSYTGNRLTYKNREFRICSDDSISATISDPTKIERSV